jgi:hypothetical protein
MEFVRLDTEFIRRDLPNRVPDLIVSERPTLFVTLFGNKATKVTKGFKPLRIRVSDRDLQVTLDTLHVLRRVDAAFQTVGNGSKPVQDATTDCHGEIT